MYDEAEKAIEALLDYRNATGPPFDHDSMKNAADSMEAALEDFLRAAAARNVEVSELIDEKLRNTI